MSCNQKNIRLLVLDVDGTLTDGKVYMGPSGEAMKAFDIKDGLGIHEILPQYGITVAIITGRSSQIVENRCAELGIKYFHQGVKDKAKKIDELLELLSRKTGETITYQNTAYCGDDINDLPGMIPVKTSGGLVGCPADAVDEVKALADYVCSRSGGDGAVREFIEWIVQKVSPTNTDIEKK